MRLKVSLTVERLMADGTLEPPVFRMNLFVICQRAGLHECFATTRTLIRADNVVLDSIVVFSFMASKHNPFDEALVTLLTLVELIHEYIRSMSVIRSLG